MSLSIHCTPRFTLQLPSDLCMSLFSVVALQLLRTARDNTTACIYLSSSLELSRLRARRQAQRQPWASLCGRGLPSLKYGCLPLRSPTACQIHFTASVMPQGLGLV